MRTNYKLIVQIQNPEMEVSENTYYIEMREMWEKKVYMLKYNLISVFNEKCLELNLLTDYTRV